MYANGYMFYHALCDRERAGLYLLLKKNRLLVITSLVKEFTQFPGCIFFENTHEEIKLNYSFSYSPFPRSETLENPA